MKFFDTHCHLQFPQYKDDLSEVLGRMQALEMGGIVVGTDLESSKAGLALAREHDFLWASVGLHPNDKRKWGDISPQMEELARDPKVVAIGECGLDYFRSSGEGPSAVDRQRTRQKERFKAQIDLAKKLNKALIIHCREAHDDCSSILQKTAIAASVPVVMHFFTGTAQLAQQYLDLGCHLSFPGPITFTDMYDDSISATPLDKILAETDAPFAAPTPHRGTRNEPAYTVEVVRKLAALKGTSVKEMGEQTVKTAQKIFDIA